MITFSRHRPRSVFKAAATAAAASMTLLAAAAQADTQLSIPGRSVALNVQADNADSRDVSAALVLPLGQHVWTQLQAGSTRADLGDDSTQARMAGAGIGIQAGALRAQFGFAYREDADALELQDLSGDLTYFASRGSVGLDLFYRQAKDEQVVSRERRFRSPASVVVTESFDGNGVGLHGDFEPAEQLLLFAAGMKYDYQDNPDQTSSLRFGRLSLSGVTRDTALLEDTASVGATWKFQPVWLTLTYFRDHALDTGDLTQTTELAAAILAGTHFTITPRAGYSTSDTGEDIAYAGLSVQLDW